MPIPVGTVGTIFSVTARQPTESEDEKASTATAMLAALVVNANASWQLIPGNEAMKTLTIAVLTLATITAASAQQSTTFRDASGRTTGTVTTDSNGQKTFRDGAGRTTGTATTDSNGTTTFRDGAGRTTGTATAPRR
jgi:hypothetical protein